MTPIATPNTISGRNTFIELLKSEGVTRLFGNPGATERPLPRLSHVTSLSCGKRVAPRSSPG